MLDEDKYAQLRVWLAWPPTSTIIVAQIRGGKMAPDYDLSNLETSQVDLWI